MRFRAPPLGILQNFVMIMKKLSLILLLFVCVSASGYAQRSLRAYKLNDLTFGDVFIGLTKDIPHTSPEAAKFRVNITSFSYFFEDVRITFTLPNYLTDGTNTLNISFGASRCAWSRNDQSTGRTTFNPNAGLTVSNWFWQPNIYIWIGGVVSPPIDAVPGDYYGTIVMNVEFL